MINAQFITPFVQRWLQSSRVPQVLHIFERVVNLCNEREEIISLVMPEVGRGPFSVGVAGARPFPDFIQPHLPVHISPRTIQIGSFVVDVRPATVWQPRVNWEDVRVKSAVWQPYLPAMQTILERHRQTLGAENMTVRQRQEVGLAELINGIAQQNVEQVRVGTLKLAGLGRGLTPAGDDVLVGVMYGLWSSQLKEQVRPLVRVIVETAVPCTTTLSAAWLWVASRGEAVEAWHEFSLELAAGSGQWVEPMARILAVGHSSGVDALWGFTAVMVQNGL
ncbi:MAG: DUF2877 domain-containing protein [Chloroflexi bacterium]|nr:DUF2877 domain-containing protein [Chloroflexota bacterium]